MTNRWSVFLMVNLTQQPIKDCEIHVHTNPDTMVYWRNLFTAPFNQRWVILVRIHTHSQNIAKQLQQRWLAKTRGLQRFIAKGFYLAKPLRDEGIADIEVVPQPKWQQQQIMYKQYYHNRLDWPPNPLDLTLRGRQYRTTIENTPTQAADYIRMYDIEHDKLKEIPLHVLERFIKETNPPK